jgi:hypothetical protein
MTGKKAFPSRKLTKKRAGKAREQAAAARQPA